MSSESRNYSLVTLSDRVVPGFAGIMRASMMAGEPLSSREIKVVVGSSSHVSEDKAISFAKKVTKHIRVGRRWSFVNATVEPVQPTQFPKIGAPKKNKGSIRAGVVK